jgi:Ca2+/Na+ antiporter
MSQTDTASSDTDLGKPKSIPFWSDDPNILFQQPYMFEFYPVPGMTYEQKLNAITRTILVISLVTFLLTQSVRFLVIGLVICIAIYMLHIYDKREKVKANLQKANGLDGTEGFASNPVADYLNQMGPVPDVFTTPDSKNPFSNVLVTDYDYNPNKKPAPAAFVGSVSNSITDQAKKLVLEANPGQHDLANKLFRDLGDEYVFEQSLRPFNSNPSTTIPNDQSAFADFLYGSMVSCKEGNPFACARNMSRHTNY